MFIIIINSQSTRENTRKRKLHFSLQHFTRNHAYRKDRSVSPQLRRSTIINEQITQSGEKYTTIALQHFS